MTADIVTATKHYEAWLATYTGLQADEVRYKHAQMALKADAFPFFRGTYYRWAEVWPELCPESQSAPVVLAVGDLHLENFGTWRDREGRLVWGINDFDEADDLPFANDLIRLATSVAIAAVGAGFVLGSKKTCRAILSGYVRQLKRGGQPFVLEEEHLEMRELAMQSDREPVAYWKRLTQLLKNPPADAPPELAATLRKGIHESINTCEIRTRPRVGMGSLGKPRYLALANLMGAWVAREAKALTPPASAALHPERSANSRINDVITSAVRCPDPFFFQEGNWIIRRLAPRCSRIELQTLHDPDHERILLESMGAETANIHCGTPDARKPILQWIKSQESDWLERSVRVMTRATRHDWLAWRVAYRQMKRRRRTGSARSDDRTNATE